MSMLVNPYVFASGAAGITLDSYDMTGFALSGGDLVATLSGGGSVYGTQGKTSGKWRFRVTITTSSSGGTLGYAIGLASPFLSHTPSTEPGSTDLGINYRRDGGVRYNGATSYSSTALTATDYVDVLVDCDAERVWFLRNGTVQNGDPDAGTGGTDISTGTTIPLGNECVYPAIWSELVGTPVFTCDFAGPFSGYAAFAPWTQDTVPDRDNFRGIRIHHRAGFFFAYAYAELSVSVASAGANLLSGGTAFAHNSSGGAASNLIDGNTTTFWASSNSVYTAAHSGADTGAYSNYGARYIATRGRDGGGGGEQQAPTLYNVHYSDATGKFHKGPIGLTAAYSGTTPGTLVENALPF